MKRVLFLILLVIPYVMITSGQTISTAQISIQNTSKQAYQGLAYASCLGVANAPSPYTFTLVSGSGTQDGITFSAATGCFSGTPTTGSPSWVIQGRGSVGPPTANTTVTLPIAALSSITAGPTGQSIHTAATLQLTAQATWSIGPSTSIITVATWACSGTGYSSVTSPGGLFTASGSAGSPTCTASLAGVSSSALTITVSSSSPTITNGATLPAPCDLNFPCPTTQLNATGGTAPYTWAITSGAPTGCGSSVSSAGVYMCTPTASGTFSSFIIKVTDSASNSTSKTFTQVVGSISTRTNACSPTTITQGATSQCAATITFSDGGTQIVTSGSAGLKVVNSWTDGGTCGSTSDCQVTVSPPTGADLRAVGNQGADNSSGITCTDNLSQSWTTDQTNTSYGPREFAVCHLFNTAAGETTVHCHTTAAASHMTCMVIAITGDNQTFDTAGHLTSFIASTPATSINSASYTSTNASDLICFFVGLATDQSGASFSLTSPFSLINSTSRLAAGCETVSSIQTSLQATMNWTTSTQNSGGIIDALEASGSAGAAWSSGATCTVSSSGLVTGTQTGGCAISFTYGGGSSNSVTVTVNGSQMDTALIVSPNPGSGIEGGSNVQFTATGNVTGASYTSTATWTPTNSSIATYISNGQFSCVNTAVSDSTNVNASFGTLTGGTAVLNCSPQTSSTGELLRGCTYIGSGGCALPAGWTTKIQQDFECTNSHASPANPSCGTLPSNTVVPASSPNGSFQTIQNHTPGGTYSWGGTFLSSNNPNLSIYYNPNGGLMGTIHSVYGSIWIYRNNQFMFGNSDFQAGISLVPGSGFNGGNSTTACSIGTNAQYFGSGFSTLTTDMLVSISGDPSSIPCQGGSVTQGVGGNAVGANFAANQGTWTQVEILITPNTTVTLPISGAPNQISCDTLSPSTAGCGNGEIAMWVNGVKAFDETNLNVNGGSSGTNFVTDPEVWLGSFLTAFSDNNGDYCGTFTIGGSQPGTSCPPPGGYYIDDIIILAQ